MLIIGDIELNINPTNRFVLIKNGLIYTIFCGDQTAASVSQSGLKVNHLIQKMRQKGSPVLILSDISKLGQINLGARKAGVHLFRELEYDKLALVGVTFLTKQLVKTIITASGRGYKIRTFDQEDEAKKWLLNHN